MSSSAKERLPNEIYLEIQSQLPQLEKHRAPDMWHSINPKIPKMELSPMERHSRVWNSIFASDEWLNATVEDEVNPMLLGWDLHRLWNKNLQDSEIYLALVIGSDRAMNMHWDKWLRESLKPHRQEVTKKGRLFEEFWFLEHRILLNIFDVKSMKKDTEASQPKRLACYSGNRSKYLYWNDPAFKLRSIPETNIRGVPHAHRLNIAAAFMWRQLSDGYLELQVFHRRIREPLLRQFRDSRLREISHSPSTGNTTDSSSEDRSIG